MLLRCVSRSCSALLILGPTPNATRKQRRTPRHLSCEFPLFRVLFQDVDEPGRLSCCSSVLMGLLTPFRPMVSEPINSSLFHQLAEQLQQQNLEQFQKQLLEHQQHQQKVAPADVPTSVSHRAFGVPTLYKLFSFFQTISIEGQDSLFGPDNCVASTQNSSQAQLPETDNKLDDSIDNQQQVRLIGGSEKQEGCRSSAYRDAVSWLHCCRTWIWTKVPMAWRRRTLKPTKRKR